MYDFYINQIIKEISTYCKGKGMLRLVELKDSQQYQKKKIILVITIFGDKPLTSTRFSPMLLFHKIVFASTNTRNSFPLALCEKLWRPFITLNLLVHQLFKHILLISNTDS